RRSELANLVGGGGGGGAWFLQAGRDRHGGRARLRRRQRCRTSARRNAAFFRWPGLFADLRLPGLEGRQASVRSLAILILVPRRSRRPRREARRPCRAQGIANFVIHGGARSRPSLPVGAVGDRP